jgi:hypothetical protein
MNSICELGKFDESCHLVPPFEVRIPHNMLLIHLHFILLNSRLNPTVTFPFTRGPYPKYDLGVPLDLSLDDSSDARAGAKDLLTYIGAFTKDELVDWDVTMTEGAESGMVATWGAKVTTKKQNAPSMSNSKLESY